MTGLSAVVMAGAYLGNLGILILILVWIFEFERAQSQLIIILLCQRQLAGDWWEKDQLTE